MTNVDALLQWVAAFLQKLVEFWNYAVTKLSWKDADLPDAFGKKE